MLSNHTTPQQAELLECGDALGLTLEVLHAPSLPVVQRSHLNITSESNLRLRRPQWAGLRSTTRPASVGLLCKA